MNETFQYNFHTPWVWLVSQGWICLICYEMTRISRVSTFASQSSWPNGTSDVFCTQGPPASEIWNSNRKLINVHDAKRIVNLSKNSQQLLLKWKFGCFFTKWFFLVFAMFKWQPMHAEKSWFVNPPFVRSPCGKMGVALKHPYYPYLPIPTHTYPYLTKTPILQFYDT